MRSQRRLALAMLLIGIALLALARSVPAQTASDTARVVHLLQRATYGPRPQDIARVLEMGVEGWLDWQLSGMIDDSALEPRLAAYPAATMSPAELFAEYPPPRLARRGIEPTMDEDGSLSTRLDSGATRRRHMRELGTLPPARIVADLAGAKLHRAVYAERQLEEVMTDFWYNHFNVFWGKGPAKWMVADFESVAIRPHVFGSFEDMLVAVAQHPAMLVYLDNWRSAAPRSETAGVTAQRVAVPRRVPPRTGVGETRAGRKNIPTDINENYARELLELHTLGVDGGYTQADVEMVARAFTGWTLDGGRRGMKGREGNAPPGRVAAHRPAIGFRFRPEMHEAGEKTILGQTLPAGRGVEDGLDVLHHLARHPSTAHHVATKLVEAFVADTAPAALVDEIATVFRDTKGDLAAVTRALFESAAFYAPEYAGAKLKSPFELVASALRMTGAEVASSRDLLAALRSLDHLPYLETAPTGYPEASAAWASGGAMLQRMNLALALAAGEVDGVRIDLDEIDGQSPDSLDEILASLLPAVDTARLEAVIRQDLEGTDPADEVAAVRALGLVLGSPEFQRH